jgi:hypothetical protein
VALKRLSRNRRAVNGLQYYRRIKLGIGVSLNLGKRRAGASVDKSGVHKLAIRHRPIRPAESYSWPKREAHMRRRDLLALGAGTAASYPWIGRAQQKPMPVIGFLGIAAPAPFAPFVAAFHEGLRETGYTEGRNVAVEYRWAEGRADRLPELAAGLAARKVDVIATIGGPLAVQEARRATSSIPIVFEIGTDPVEAGFAASMARPGGKLTGVTIMTLDLNPKRLELLSEMTPQARV